MVDEQLNDIEVEKKIPSVMSDGTTLYCDVYRPRKPGRYPVIVERVAYELDSRLEPYAEFYARRGYVFVGQNTRGTYWSEGEFRGVKDDGWGEHRDGYDTIEWVASRPWSDGNIGTMDGSWSGLTQNLLAVTRPPHLRTMFLRMAPAGLVESGGGIPGIGLRAGMLQHTLQRANHPSASERLKSYIPRIEEALSDMKSLFDLLPSSKSPVIDEVYPKVGQVLGGKPNDSDRLETDATKKAEEVDVPVFHLGGWYDILLENTLAMYDAVRNKGFSERARINQKLLIGPWVHGPMEPDNPVQGDIDFGPEAVLGINEFRLKWFDFWLKGRSEGVLNLPNVRLFVMGENRWRDFTDWPPEGTTSTKLFLRNPEPGRGGRRLTFEAPDEAEGFSSYDFDPHNPPPNYRGDKPGFQANGPIDLRPGEDHQIVFTSAPLDMDIDVIGPLRAKIWASSSARDTDWFVTITDVHPDGRSMRVQNGSLRARYRDGFDHEVLMAPDKPYLFDIGLKATAQRFRAGHRIRIAITSSQFPPAERNMNTGGENAMETAGVLAHNTLFHDQEHPSHLVLPVMT